MVTANRRTGFREIKQEILRRIHDGTWGPGTLIPGEVTLAEEFGCARTTVNRALGELSAEGLVERKRKAGTRVLMSPRRSARFEIPLVRDEIEKTGARYRYNLVSQSQIKAPDWLASRLSLGAGSQIVHVRCVHYAGSTAFQYEERWINCEAVPAAKDVEFTQQSPNEWLVHKVPFSNAEISFYASGADATTAEFLQLQTGSPVFTTERTTWWEGNPVTLARLHFQSGYRMTSYY